jgi:hypothetical protein
MSNKIRDSRFLKIRDKIGLIEREAQSRKSQLARIQHNAITLDELDTPQKLMVYNKNDPFPPIEGHTWELPAFLHCKELVADPVFQNLREVYEAVGEIKGWRDSSHAKMIRGSLSYLANKMANRTMTEEEYLSILEGKHEELVRGCRMINALSQSPVSTR